MRYVNDSERNTCQHEDNMKKTLIRVKERKSDNQKHENDTCKNKGAWKKQFAKLIEIEVQSQPNVRDCQWKHAQTVDLGLSSYTHYLDGLWYGYSSLRKRMCSWTCCGLSMCE